MCVYYAAYNNLIYTHIYLLTNIIILVQHFFLVMLFVCALVYIPCLRTYTYKQEKSEHNYLRCRDSLCHSTHTSAIETWVRNRALLRTLVFIFVLKPLFTTISGTFWALLFFWPGKTIPHYIKNVRFKVKQRKISEFGTAKPKNSFLFKFAIVHIPCVFCVCPQFSTARTACLAHVELSYSKYCMKS